MEERADRLLQQALANLRRATQTNQAREEDSPQAKGQRYKKRLLEYARSVEEKQRASSSPANTTSTQPSADSAS